MSADEKGYNGWTNYETWAVALWLDNDEGSYRSWGDAAQECWDDAETKPYSSREQQARIALAERLKDELQEAMPELGATLWADLLQASFGSVDWHEIAEHYLDDVDKDVPEMGDHQAHCEGHE